VADPTSAGEPESCRQRLEARLRKAGIGHHDEGGLLRLALGESDDLVDAFSIELVELVEPDGGATRITATLTTAPIVADRDRDRLLRLLRGTPLDYRLQRAKREGAARRAVATSDSQSSGWRPSVQRRPPTRGGGLPSTDATARPAHTSTAGSPAGRSFKASASTNRSSHAAASDGSGPVSSLRDRAGQP
jgi:hypothetical protein